MTCPTRKWLNLRRVTSEPFTAANFSDDESHEAVYFISVHNPDGTSLSRAVSHHRMFQDGKYPRLREWLEQSRAVKKFLGIAPD